MKRVFNGTLSLTKNPRWSISSIQSLFENLISKSVLTGVHYRLPLAAPLAELLGVLFLHLCSLHEAGHDVVAGLEGLFSSVHCPHIIPRLGGGKTVMMCKKSCSFTNTHKLCFGLTCYSLGDRKCNPHHPETLFLGILGWLFGKACHYWKRFCLRK